MSGPAAPDAFSQPGFDRAEFMFEAAERLDALSGHLSLDESSSTTEVAQGVRAMAKQDEGQLSKPIIYVMRPDDIPQSFPVPITKEELTRLYSFCLVQYPFSLKPATGWEFQKLNMHLEFNPGSDPVRPKVYRLFPSTEFQEKFKADASLNVRVTPKAEFALHQSAISVDVGVAGAKIGGSLEASAESTAGLKIGPFSVTAKAAKITASRTGLEWADWELLAEAVTHGNDLPLMTVLQIPKSLATLQVHQSLSASRVFDLVNFGLLKAMSSLPEVFQRFFRGGAPYSPEAKDWDLSKEIDLSHEGR